MGRGEVKPRQPAGLIGMERQRVQLLHQAEAEGVGAHGEPLRLDRCFAVNVEPSLTMRFRQGKRDCLEYPASCILSGAESCAIGYE